MVSWGGGFKLLLHWRSWEKIPFSEENEFRSLNPRGWLRAQLRVGSSPWGRLGKYREIKREQQILLVIQEGGGCRGRGFLVEYF